VCDAAGTCNIDCSADACPDGFDCNAQNACVVHSDAPPANGGNNETAGGNAKGCTTSGAQASGTSWSALLAGVLALAGLVRRRRPRAT
jgi:MYXO-CTERM domain-containing protein